MSDTPQTTPTSPAPSAPHPQSPITKPASDQTRVMISDESLASKVLIKAAPGTAAATQLDVGFGSSERRDNTLVLGTRPDEWLLVADSSALADQIPTEGFVSVIDWTHSRGMIRVTGDDAAHALSKVCNIDFGDHMMPNGAVLSVGVASVGTDMVRDDVDGTLSYLLLFDRSFGQSLYDALIDAAAEFRRF